MDPLRSYNRAGATSTILREESEAELVAAERDFEAKLTQLHLQRPRTLPVGFEQHEGDRGSSDGEASDGSVEEAMGGAGAGGSSGTGDGPAEVVAGFTGAGGMEIGG